MAANNTSSVFYLRLSKISGQRFFCEQEEGNCENPAVFVKLAPLPQSNRHLKPIRFLCWLHYKKEAT